MKRHLGSFVCFDVTFSGHVAQGLHRALESLSATNEPKSECEDEDGTNHQWSPVHGDRLDGTNTWETQNDGEKDDPKNGDKVDRHTPSTKVERTLVHVITLPHKAAKEWHAICNVHTNDGCAHDSRPVDLTSKWLHIYMQKVWASGEKKSIWSLHTGIMTTIQMTATKIRMRRGASCLPDNL